MDQKTGIAVAEHCRKVLWEGERELRKAINLIDIAPGEARRILEHLRKDWGDQFFAINMALGDTTAN